MTIIGPESIMNKIGNVVAQVDVSGMSKDDTRQSEIKVYDKNLEELSEKQMSYLKFDIQSTTIDVNVELWKVKQDVPVEVKYSNGKSGILCIPGFFYAEYHQYCRNAGSLKTV